MHDFNTHESAVVVIGFPDSLTFRNIGVFIGELKGGVVHFVARTGPVTDVMVRYAIIIVIIVKPVRNIVVVVVLKHGDVGEVAVDEDLQPVFQSITIGVGDSGVAAGDALGRVVGQVVVAVEVPQVGHTVAVAVAWQEAAAELHRVVQAVAVDVVIKGVTDTVAVVITETLDGQFNVVDIVHAGDAVGGVGADTNARSGLFHEPVAADHGPGGGGADVGVEHVHGVAGVAHDDADLFGRLLGSRGTMADVVHDVVAFPKRAVLPNDLVAAVHVEAEILVAFSRCDAGVVARHDGEPAGGVRLPTHHGAVVDRRTRNRSVVEHAGCLEAQVGESPVGGHTARHPVGHPVAVVVVVKPIVHAVVVAVVGCGGVGAGGLDFTPVAHPVAVRVGVGGVGAEDVEFVHVGHAVAV